MNGGEGVVLRSIEALFVEHHVKGFVCVCVCVKCAVGKQHSETTGSGNCLEL